MRRRKGFSVFVLLLVLMFIIACQPLSEEAINSVQLVEETLVVEDTTEFPIVEESTRQIIEPITLDSEQAVLSQLNKVLES